jgi:hypothetical protein
LKLNIICGNRYERKPLLIDELERQGIDDFEFWEGIYLPSVKASINAAHRQIVEFAQVAGYKEVMIAEDDFMGTHSNSFKYFLANKPPTFDIYLSQVYLGDIDETKRVEKFTGMTLYIVAEKFYDKFLSVNPEEHIDHALANLGDYHVCNPFAFIQRDGYSSNTGKHEKYGSLLANRKLYLG